MTQKFHSQVYTENSRKHMPHKNLHLDVHSTINNSQKVKTTQMSINWWMYKQMWYIHTMKYYSVIKRNKLLINATTWINLKTLC